MKQVTKFEANDGTVFDTEAAAVAHDNLTDLEEWYEDNKIYSMYGSRVEWADLLEFCQQHRDKVKEILTAC